MEIITSVQIRKFRSIKSLVRGFNPTHLNILVGQNDQGKSNILRALNLFFNNETDIGQAFRFDDDYCFHANTGTGTRREIRIDLTITPPRRRFKHARPLKWVKKWRRDGSIDEKRIYIDTNEELSPRNNVSKWMDKLRYRYVPAIKGQEYFSNLMGELHDVLHEAHETVLTEQGEEFISGIQRITDELTVELQSQLGIANSIQVPSDFRVLFSNLDFGSKVDENTYHLKQRGDGIKVRHIPIILKYMADQEKAVSIPGYVKPDTIWGFEEPENNLELSYAYELAAKIKEYTSDLQVFVTTHSPAFYALDKSDTDGVNSYYISQDNTGCTNVRLVTHDDTDDIHEKMGLLPLITPYLSEINSHQEQIKSLTEELEDLRDDIDCIVLTEDENHAHVIKYFEINGFNIPRTEFIPYYGADQVKSCMILAQYLQKKRPDSYIIIHRDRDYLDENSVQQIKRKFEAKGFYAFITPHVDIESQYLNSEHINSLYPSIDIETAKDMLDLSTNEAETDSLDRLINYSFKKKPCNGDYAGEIKSLKERYSQNKARYRYGKKVCGLVRSKIQQSIGENAELYRLSEFVADERLSNLAQEIWE